MPVSVPRLLVVGGNGYLGSAVCKAAVSKGWDVSSMSSSGKPYETPASHTPKWVTSVKWHKASAFEPSSYTDLVKDSTAVVHTLGILLEDQGYKASVRNGDLFGLMKAVAKGLTGSGESSNPLKKREDKLKGYEGMNRDSALTVLDAVLSSSSSSSPAGPSRPFVYISAADAFRPLVPSRYIETKRQAEFEIARRCAEAPEAGVRPVFIRPGLMYHPHIRPLSTLPAFLLSLSATAHDRLQFPNPFASKSLLGGAADALRTHPIHVDHVASAVVRCIEDQGKEGVVDVEEMRKWAGFLGNVGGVQEGKEAPGHA